MADTEELIEYLLHSGSDHPEPRGLGRAKRFRMMRGVVSLPHGFGQGAVRGTLKAPAENT